jgi:glyoxalase family protein
MSIIGLHHVTLGTADARRNFAFHTGPLGMRLAKKTVNFDDPSSYHLYYTDAAATAGSAVTFFEWAGARRGAPGIGGVSRIALQYGDGSGPERVMPDPDGVEYALRGDPASGYVRLSEIIIWSSDLDVSHSFYGDLLGLHAADVGPGERTWSATPAGAPIVRALRKDARSTPRARMGAGQTHHFAFAVADDPTQLAFQRRIAAAGLRISPVMDRSYFHSIYTADPDGLIIEIATVPPGFTVDEPLAALGTQLQLPPWLEPHRNNITVALTPLS